MKKRICFWGTIFCLMFCTLSVRADLIWEPQDSFYRTHAESCTYVTRRFTAKGPDGQVIVYKSPESPKVIATLENGTEVWVSYTYLDRDGVLWGIHEGSREETGWMPMEYMQVVYDFVSFEEEYGAEIVEQTGRLGEEYKGKDIFFWNYPGSEEYTATPMDGQEMPEYDRTFTDEKGHIWGIVGYYYGMGNSWICVDQPTADYEELYPDGGPGIGTQTEDGNPGSQGSERIVPKRNAGTVILTTALVAAVAFVTAGLLVVLKRRSKS